jgi:hypothetical protein
MGHHSIREREPLPRPDATAIDGTAAMAGAARGIIAQPGSVIANVMFRRRAEREITKKKRPSAYPPSFRGSLAHYRGRASLMVRSFICHFTPIFPNYLLESDDEL